MDKVGRKEGYSAFERMGERYSAENYINYHNRLYNYAFRDTECVERGHCEFPKHSEEQHFYDLDLPDDKDIVVVFGTETSGLTLAKQEMLDETIKLPMDKSKVDFLTLPVAVSAIAYELYRKYNFE